MKRGANKNPSSISFERAVALGLGTWPRGTVFLVAVSGGADSSAMLAALAGLRFEGNYELHCLHVEHGIRPAEESWGDALAVKELSKNLDVPCYIVSIPPGKIEETAGACGLGIEGVARFFRRRIWNQEIRRIGAKRILVAHTQDDLLETVLMRFLRGSGSAGLAPMLRERGHILRPLLGLTRTRVLDYLRLQGIPFRTDSTNRDIHYLRNRIRHTLIPLLDDLFPFWKKGVLAMAKTQGLISDFLSLEAKNRVPWEKDRERGTLRTQRGVFFSQPSVIQEEALFQGSDILAAGLKKKSGAGFQYLGFTPDSAAKRCGEGVPAVPRRETLRLFVQRKLPAIDAGPIRIEQQGDSIALVSSTRKASTNYYCDRGFALLIKEPGIYKVKELKVVCRSSSGWKDFGSLSQGIPEKESLFFACLPLVFRPFYRDNNSIKGLNRVGYSRYINSIMAEDQKGPVACIIQDKEEQVTVLCREEKSPEEDGAVFSFIIVSGGTNV